MELLYTVNLESDEPIMLIDKHIGFDEELGVGIMGSQFQKELLFLDTLNKKRIQVWINSPGGSVMDGYDICSAIMRTKTKVDTYCNGICASMAAPIFLSGRKRYMADFGILMVHDAYEEDEEGNKTQSDSTKKMNDSLVSIIVSRTGIDEAKLREMMKVETWLSASEALSEKLCDEIESSSDMNIPRLKKGENIVSLWREAQVTFNKVKDLKNEKPKIMKELAKVLNLNEEAKEASFVSAVADLSAKAKASDDETKKKEEELKAMKAKMEEDEKKYKALEDEHTKAKAAISDADAKAKTAEEKEVKAKADILVKDAVKIGKISNDVKAIEVWSGKAVADFDGTKAMIDALPLNRKCANISEEIVKAESKDGVPAINPANTTGYVAVMNAKNLANARNRFK